jgi:hypothetical protein
MPPILMSWMCVTGLASDNYTKTGLHFALIMHNDTYPIMRIPSDLTIWIGDRTLASLVLDVTTNIGQSMLRLESPNSRWHRLCPQMLLGFLTYCYATGVLSSNEIACRSQQAGMIRYLSAYTLPEEKVLKAFRRRWRPLLQQSLVRLFKLAWHYHFGEASEFGAADVALEAQCPIHELHRIFQDEAELRILRAIHFDTIEADV